MEPILIVIVFVIYFIPAIISASRGHPANMSIFFLNLLLGWSLLGWVAALVWSFTNPAQVVVHNQVPQSTADEIQKFANLKKQGLLTDEEFNKKKSELLNDV